MDWWLIPNLFGRWWGTLYTALTLRQSDAAEVQGSHHGLPWIPCPGALHQGWGDSSWDPQCQQLETEVLPRVTYRICVVLVVEVFFCCCNCFCGGGEGKTWKYGPGVGKSLASLQLAAFLQRLRLAAPQIVNSNHIETRNWIPFDRWLAACGKKLQPRSHVPNHTWTTKFFWRFGTKKAPGFKGCPGKLTGIVVPQPFMKNPGTSVCSPVRWFLAYFLAWAETML